MMLITDDAYNLLLSIKGGGLLEYRDSELIIKKGERSFNIYNNMRTNNKHSFSKSSKWSSDHEGRTMNLLFFNIKTKLVGKIYW